MWTCKKCTFENDAVERACAMCSETDPAILLQLQREEEELQVVTALKRKWDEDDARSSVFEEWEDGEDDAVVTTGNSSTSSGQQRSSVNNHPGAASVSTSGVAGLTTQIADIIRLGGGMAGRTVRLCTPSLVYFAQRDSYTCGYRNLQMLLSSLPQGDPKWTCALQKFKPGGTVPSVYELQQALELAWKDGFDKQGSKQLGERVVGTRKWIGASDVATVLRWAGIHAELYDFTVARGSNGTHPDLFNFVADFYTTPKAKGEAPSSALSALMKSGSTPTATNTDLPPIFLQHFGHSRTIVGVDIRSSDKNDAHLLILDPAFSQSKQIALRQRPIPIVRTGRPSVTLLRGVRVEASRLVAKQYQLVVVKGLYPSESARLASKLLTSIQIT